MREMICCPAELQEQQGSRGSDPVRSYQQNNYKSNLDSPPPISHLSKSFSLQQLPLHLNVGGSGGVGVGGQHGMTPATLTVAPRPDIQYTVSASPSSLIKTSSQSCSSGPHVSTLILLFIDRLHLLVINTTACSFFMDGDSSRPSK